MAQSAKKKTLVVIEIIKGTAFHSLFQEKGRKAQKKIC